MAETYSIAATASHGASIFAAKTHILPDSASQAGHVNYLGQRGSQILCKKPDGSLAWFTIDTSRSLPGGSIVILPVGP